MKKILFIIIPFYFISMGLYAQNESLKKINQPKTNIEVKREYDKNGNLIRYDSTYSYYYSNIENDSLFRDSLLNQFQNHFKKRHLFFEDQFYRDYFFSDSLFDFNSPMKDFFEEFRNKKYQMEDFFWEMDSIRKRFLLKPIQK